MALKSRFRYWAGTLIDEHEIIDDRPLDKDSCRIGPAPPPIHPRPPMGNSMPVSDKNFWGILTNDIKVVEWYVAENRAHGVAVYFEDGDSDDENDQAAPMYYDGKFLGWLYDRADAQTAVAELDYRDRLWLRRLALHYYSDNLPPF